MTTPVARSGVVAIRRSPWKSVGLVIGAGLLVAVSVWLIRGGAAATLGEVTLAIGWVGAVLFGTALVLLLLRLGFGAAEPVFLSPEGILDRRLARSVIPWSEVIGAGVWTHRGTSMVQLQLSPAGCAALQLTRSGALTHRINAPFLGSDRFHFGTADLAIGFTEFWVLVQDHLRAHHPAALQG